jgi:hypothetical protein
MTMPFSLGPQVILFKYLKKLQKTYQVLSSLRIGFNRKLGEVALLSGQGLNDTPWISTSDEANS